MGKDGLGKEYMKAVMRIRPIREALFCEYSALKKGLQDPREMRRAGEEG